MPQFETLISPGGPPASHGHFRIFLENGRQLGGATFAHAPLQALSSKENVIRSLSAQGLNQDALQVFEQMVAHAESLRVAEVVLPCGARLLDCGVEVDGGLEAGRHFAALCLAGRAQVSVAGGDASVWAGPWIQVASDDAVRACMFGQYAGWPVQHEKFFAMGSGAMRVKRGKEEVLTACGAQDDSPHAVGALECDGLPSCEVARHMADDCGVPVAQLRLAVAPTRSLAGCVQVVARSVETALHKLHELGFSLEQVVSAHGIAPLPPPTPDFAAGIGRTNDAILYGGTVTLWLDGEDEQIEQVSGRLPSDSSSDFGEPFADIFERYKYDFYQVDPGLFSPARVLLYNVRSGRSWLRGQVRADLVQRSFGLEGDLA